MFWLILVWEVEGHPPHLLCSRKIIHLRNWERIRGRVKLKKKRTRQVRRKKNKEKIKEIEGP